MNIYNEKIEGQSGDLRLGIDSLQFIVRDEKEAGEYIVRAVVKDRIKDVSLKLETRFTVLP